MIVNIPDDHDPSLPVSPRKRLGEVVRCQDNDSFCVPAAISACTGFSTGQIAKIILKNRDARDSSYNKNSKVVSLWNHGERQKRLMVGGVRGCETEWCLKELGISFRAMSYSELKDLRNKIYKPKQNVFGHILTYPRLSLAGFMDNLPEDIKGKRLLISLSGHMIAGQDGMLVDNQKHIPVDRKWFGSGRARIASVLVLD